MTGSKPKPKSKPNTETITETNTETSTETTPGPNPESNPKCKIWSSDMLPPPIWTPSFEFLGLVTEMNTDLTDSMKIKNVVRSEISSD